MLTASALSHFRFFHRFRCITMIHQVRRRGQFGCMEKSFRFQRQAGSQSHRLMSPFKFACLMAMLCCFVDASTFTGAMTCRALRLHSLHFFYTLSIKNGTGRTSSSLDRKATPPFEVRRSQISVRLPRRFQFGIVLPKAKLTKN